MYFLHFSDGYASNLSKSSLQFVGSIRTASVLMHKFVIITRWQARDKEAQQEHLVKRELEETAKNTVVRVNCYGKLGEH